MKGKRFESWRSVGLAIQAIKVHATRGVDEVVLLDIAATREERCADLELVRELAEFLFMPLTVGGGVRSVDDVKNLLRAGADKVVIGSAALQRDLIRSCADIVGSQAIVVSVDAKSDGYCYINNGLEWIPAYAGPAAFSFECEGAGEILLQAIDRDGTMEGYDLELIRVVASQVDIPVIASGGCSGYEDMRQAILAGASAVAAGALFQFEDATPRGAAQYLARNGVEVRLPGQPD